MTVAEEIRARVRDELAEPALKLQRELLERRAALRAELVEVSAALAELRPFTKPFEAPKPTRPSKTPRALKVNVADPNTRGGQIADFIREHGGELEPLTASKVHEAIRHNGDFPAVSPATIRDVILKMHELGELVMAGTVKGGHKTYRLMKGVRVDGAAT